MNPHLLRSVRPQIKELSTRYSEFISFPIEVWAEKTSYDQVPDTTAEVAEGEEPKMKTVTRTSMEWEVCLCTARGGRGMGGRILCGDIFFAGAVKRVF